MKVYREFVVDENTREIEVRYIDEATGREVNVLDSGAPRSVRQLDWLHLLRTSRPFLNRTPLPQR
jgi:hypothetical protein